MALKVFSDDSIDWVIAETADEAYRLMQHHTGEYDEEEYGNSFVECKSDEWLSIRFDYIEDMFYCDGFSIPSEAKLAPYGNDGMEIAATCGQWAKCNPAGFLCSSNY